MATLPEMRPELVTLAATLAKMPNPPPEIVPVLVLATMVALPCSTSMPTPTAEILPELATVAAVPAEIPSLAAPPAEIVPELSTSAISARMATLLPRILLALWTVARVFEKMALLPEMVPALKFVTCTLLPKTPFAPPMIEPELVTSARPLARMAPPDASAAWIVPALWTVALPLTTNIATAPEIVPVLALSTVALPCCTSMATPPAEMLPELTTVAAVPAKIPTLPAPVAKILFELFTFAILPASIAMPFTAEIVPALAPMLTVVAALMPTLAAPVPEIVLLLAVTVTVPVELMPTCTPEMVPALASMLTVPATVAEPAEMPMPSAPVAEIVRVLPVTLTVVAWMANLSPMMSPSLFTVAVPPAWIAMPPLAVAWIVPV